MSALSITRKLTPRFMPDGAYDVLAGQQRIPSAQRAACARADRINKALIVLRRDVRTDEDVVRVLHAVSAGLMTDKPVSSDTADTVEKLDAVADEIQFRNEPS